MAVRSEVRQKIAGVGFRGILNHDDLITDIPGETPHRPDGQPDLIQRVTHEDQNGNDGSRVRPLGLPITLQNLGAFSAKTAIKSVDAKRAPIRAETGELITPRGHVT